jgi:hypothetical protein
VQAVRNRSSSTTALPDSPKDAGPNVEAVFGADLIYVGEDLEPHATGFLILALIALAFWGLE